MILVAGGTGFIGHHLVHRLVADGQPVRVLTRQPGRASVPEGVESIAGDLTVPDSLATALDGVRTVVNLAAVLPGSAASQDRLQQVNAQGAEALARAAREAGIVQLIHVSSAGVYGDGADGAPHLESESPEPSTPYERSKWLGEQAVESCLTDSATRWTILRPTGVYGADRPATAAFFRRVARRPVWLYGPARAIVHPVHVTDVVAVIQAALDREDLDAEVINVAGARPVTSRELVSLIAARIGRRPLQLSAPRWTAHVAAVIARTWGAIGQPPDRLQRLARAWINRSVSIEKARRLLGFEPVSLEWGIEETAAELRRKQQL